MIRRDFEAKAPTGTEILERIDSDAYRSRYRLLCDLAMNLVWSNRYAITMYEKRPTRWRDLPRHRDDVFLPLLTPGELGALADPDGSGGSLLDGIDLVVPHQADKTMVTDAVVAAGLTPDRLYFNVEKVGNVSAASIPLAIHDAVREEDVRAAFGG